MILKDMRNSCRIHQLNKQCVFNNGKYILYIMRCIRTNDSPSLQFSIEEANLLKIPLICAFFYCPGLNFLIYLLFSVFYLNSNYLNYGIYNKFHYT